MEVFINFSGVNLECSSQDRYCNIQVVMYAGVAIILVYFLIPCVAFCHDLRVVCCGYMARFLRAVVIPVKEILLMAI